MKIGIITDVHNNKLALDLVLEKFKEEGCQGIICSGDFIGIGPFPEETVKTLMSSNLFACVRGNHESYLTDDLPSSVPNSENMGLEEIEHHKWEHSILSQEAKNFIFDLPYEKTVEINGYKIYVSHYSIGKDTLYGKYYPNPSSDELDIMFEGIDADVIVYGHNHNENITFGNRLYINAGSLGCPSHDNMARAGILDLNDKIEYIPLKLSYNIKDVVDAIHTINYPAKNEILKYFYGQD